MSLLFLLFHFLQKISISIAFSVEFASITAKILALRHEKQFFDELDGGESGKKCGILLDSSCFYAEQGGQMCDFGYMNKEGNEVGLLVANFLAAILWCAEYLQSVISLDSSC